MSSSSNVSQCPQVLKITERTCAVIGGWKPYVDIMIKYKGKYKNDLNITVDNTSIRTDGWVFPKDMKQSIEYEIMMMMQKYGNSSSTATGVLDATTIDIGITPTPNQPALNTFGTLPSKPIVMAKPALVQSASIDTSVSGLTATGAPEQQQIIVPSVTKREIVARIIALENAVYQIQQQLQQLWLVK